MLLPVFITDHWLSALLISEEEFAVKKAAFYKFPYDPSEFTRKLSTKRLNKILTESVGKEVKGARQIIISNLKSSECLFSINYEYKNLAKYLPFPVILLDSYSGNQSEGVLELDQLNGYLNNKHYGFDIEPDIVEKLLLAQFKDYINANTGDFLDIHTIGLLTSGPITDKKSFAKKIVNTLADEIKINGYWRISIDDNAGLVPMIAALAEESMDPVEYFEKNPISIDIKLIVASGVDKIEISKYDGDDKLEPELRELEKNKITYLNFKADEKIELNWKAKKSKFNGSMHGSPSGILIDNRERELS